MSEWIKVEDRLPEIKEGFLNSRDVLTICESHGEASEFGFINAYRKGEKYLSIDRLVKWRDKEYPSFNGDRFYGKVTHWAELPEFPKE